MRTKTGWVLSFAALSMAGVTAPVFAQYSHHANPVQQAEPGYITYNRFYQPGSGNSAAPTSLTTHQPIGSLNVQSSQPFSAPQQTPTQFASRVLQDGVRTLPSPSQDTAPPALQGSVGVPSLPSVAPAPSWQPGSPAIGSASTGSASTGSAPTGSAPATSHALPQVTANTYFRNANNCDAPISGQPVSNDRQPSQDAGSSFNQTMYQRPYLNRKPADYDSSCNDPVNSSTITTQCDSPVGNDCRCDSASLYDEITARFQSRNMQSSECDTCDSTSTRSGLFSFLSHSSDSSLSCNTCDKGHSIYFGNYEALFGLPYYSDNHSAASITDGGLTRIEPFDYDMVYASRFVAGVETPKGPGGILEVFNLSANSNVLTAVQPSGTSSVIGALNVPFANPILTTTPAGGRLEAQAQQDISNIRLGVFKRIYWPISTLSGGLGLQYTTIDQRLNYSNFTSPAATVANMTLNGTRRFEGLGPSFSMQYHRPIGHTHLAAIGGLQTSVIFGSDQWEVLSDAARVYENHSSRVLTNLNVSLGVEYSRNWSECSNGRWFVRTTIEGQNWLNMGSFSTVNGDFGFISGNLAIGMAY